MPAGRHPNLATQQPGVHTRPGSSPQQQTPLLTPDQQSRGSIPKKVPVRSSAFLKKRNSNKKVRWDFMTVDNEKTPKTPSVRSPTPPLIKWPTGLSQGPAHLSQIPSTSTVGFASVANTSAKMYSPSVRPPQSARPSDPAPRLEAYFATQHAAAVASGRPSMHVPSTQWPDQTPVPNSVSKRKSNSTTHGGAILEIRTAALKSVQQPKVQRSTGTVLRVPPAVPDAPQPRVQGLPPTPRITRLPTPDLPELGESAFCGCFGTNCSKPVDVNTTTQESKTFCTCDGANCNRPVHMKMNVQMEVAKAYMKGVKAARYGRSHRGRKSRDVVLKTW